MHPRLDLKTVAFRSLPLFYFLAVSLPHHPFSSWLDETIIIPLGYNFVQHVADYGSVALVLVLTAMGGRILVLHRRAADKYLAALFLLLILMYGADRWLIVNNIERIHFPQYATLALLLGLSLRDESLIFSLSVFAGFLDELLQFVTNPMKTNYLDFNDIFLNTLGAAAGVVLLMGLRKASPHESSNFERRLGAVFYHSLIVACFLVVLAGILGRIVLLVEQAKDRSVLEEVGGRLSFIMSFERHDSFWVKSYFGKVFHILSPAEGIAACAAIIGLVGVFLWWMRGRTASGSSDRSSS